MAKLFAILTLLYSYCAVEATVSQIAYYDRASYMDVNMELLGTQVVLQSVPLHHASATGCGLHCSRIDTCQYFIMEANQCILLIETSIQMSVPTHVEPADIVYKLRDTGKPSQQCRVPRPRVHVDRRASNNKFSKWL